MDRFEDLLAVYGHIRGGDDAQADPVVLDPDDLDDDVGTDPNPLGLFPGENQHD